MIKTFEDYRVLAARTLNNDLDPDLQLAIYGLGLAGESGEVIELIKKQFGHGHTIDTQKLKLELGDVLWYVAAIATRLNATAATHSPLSAQDLTLDEEPHIFSNHQAVYVTLRLGEYVGLVSGAVVDMHPFREQSEWKIKDCLSLILTALSVLARLYGMTLAEIAEANIDKLKARYPDGFECDRSINRTV